jgi:hypothetical protein
VLQGVDLLVEQFVGHGDLADLGHETGDLLVLGIGLAALERRLAGRKEGLTPPSERRGRHAQFA